MRSSPIRFFALIPVCFVLMVLPFLAACGSSGIPTQKLKGMPPQFTSMPVTQATQGVAYTYQLSAVDPSGGSVTFSLTTSPTGAALSGNTVTWTPTAAQSRVSNSFEVTATTTSGGTATQSWTVTPGGTITVNWVNNYWGASGPVQVPQQASQATAVSAMWTNPDGSYTVQKASATGPGVFSIPNVPGGYYWLQAGGGTFWTNVSTFDAGSNIAGAPAPYTSGSQSTEFDFNLYGLDSVPQFTQVSFAGAVSGLPGVGLLVPPNSTGITGQDFLAPTDIDWSQINTAFLWQLVPSSLGTLNNVLLGPSLTATGLSLVDGTTNTITETLQPSTQALINLSVPGGSQWAPLFTNAAPSALTPFASALAIAAQLDVTEGVASGTGTFSGTPQQILGLSVSSLPLAGTAQPDGVFTAGCPGTGFQIFAPTPAQPAITSDQNFGALQYGDPYPSEWARTLSLCQEYTAPIPIPNSSATATFYLEDSATVAPSNSPLAPVVAPVQNPTINGASFFSAATLNSTIVPLSWSAPTGTAPFGYTVRVYVQTTVEGLPTYAATGAAFSVAGTSITLPPLAGGNAYVFAITADADGAANMLTSPFRSSLPVGYATVVSAPVTISSGALMPEIHGDRRVIDRFSRPQPRGSSH